MLKDGEPDCDLELKIYAAIDFVRVSCFPVVSPRAFTLRLANSHTSYINFCSLFSFGLKLAQSLGKDSCGMCPMNQGMKLE